jgi:sporulation protein YlmC with PRC-barrel domain
MLKRTLTAAALAAILATPAFAQTQPVKVDNQATSTMPDQSQTGDANFIHQQTANDWRGSKLIGTSVYGPDGKSIGSVNDVLIASDGKIKAVVVGVGGFLGVGEKNVALPYGKLNIARKANSASISKISVTFTKAELNKAPKFTYYQPSKSQTVGANVDMKPGATGTKAGAGNPLLNNDNTMKKNDSMKK